MCLRPAGFELATASSGAEALEVAASFEPDLVLLDIGLPDMLGWEVLAALRASSIGEDVKVAILSGYEDINTEAKARGADAVIVKPFRNDQLRELAVALIAPPTGEAAGS
jgi:two-component system KDP operon response regulator KdpE